MQIIKYPVKEKNILDKDSKIFCFAESENVFYRINLRHLLVENKTYTLCDKLVKLNFHIKLDRGIDYLSVCKTIFYRNINYIYVYYFFAFK